MLDYLKKLISELKVEYGEIRLEIKQKEGFSFRNMTLENLTTCYELGGMVSVFHNSNWAHVSFNSIKDITTAITVAEQITYLYIKGNNSLVPVFKNEYYDNKKFVDELSLKERKDIISNCYEAIIRNDSIVKCNLVYSKTKYEKSMVSTEGTYIYQKKEEDILNIELSNRTNNTKAITKSCQGFQGLGDITIFIDDALYDLNETIIQNDSLSGKYPVILSGDLAGVFFHEAFGHMCEADNVIHNRFLQTKIYKGSKITNSKLTIIDDPSLMGHSGSYLYDDEGIRSKSTCVLRDGVFEQMLHNRNTSQLLNEVPNGHGRAVNYNDLPIVRMSNFCISPGEYSLKDLINSTELGLFALGNQSGQTKSDQFLFVPKKCYLIKDGEIRYRIPVKFFKGNTFEAMNDINLTKEMVWNENGYCNKLKQDLLPISIHSPNVKLNNILVGG